MLPSYPVYDELLKRVNEREEKGIDIKRVCTTINNISVNNTPEDTAEHYREIAALIVHHEYISTGAISSNPYDWKVMVGGKGVLNYIMNLPPLLQQIIAQYIETPDLV